MEPTVAMTKEWWFAAAMKLLAGIAWLAMASCATMADPAEIVAKNRVIEREVSDQLVALPGAGERTRAEADKIARMAVKASREQAEHYNLAFKGWMHNVMVNARIKERGLCWHWMEDIYPRLRALETRDFQIVCGVRDSGTSREHHCVVAVPAGRPFEDGLVLDPWEKGGKLIAFTVRDAPRTWYYDPLWTLPLEERYQQSLKRRAPVSRPARNTGETSGPPPP